VTAHLLNGKWRAKEHFNECRPQKIPRSSYDISWADHTVDCDRSKSTLPSAHHIVNKITRLHLLVLREPLINRAIASIFCGYGDPDQLPPIFNR
jgi:hypothetical protein